MKKIWIYLLISGFIASCGGATDGDPSTDTTNLNIDTGVGSMADTAGNINTNTGTYPTGTPDGDSLNSGGTDPASRKTTSGGDGGRN
jgi:hypothetical protein